MLAIPSQKVIPMLKTLGSSKVLVQTYCSSELEAKKLIKDAKKMALIR